eukprot:1049367-Amphidinium_carterae.1
MLEGKQAPDSLGKVHYLARWICASGISVTERRGRGMKAWAPDTHEPTPGSSSTFELRRRVSTI